ncbi:M43 family zinc metalloprotease [Dyadobacter sp. CY312]|uniref:M43 family zinc metalloprotease n=1 Tax=Dyadobacter sp. CY312 TaxID=2907303 RepID=UPI001EEF6BC2|nr:M43 family zinc metalloprotease [Dyadobacter sp. CY312]MCE7038823.1 choice-of-anchor J domain-containing protein [Dyadobacter sp. CY312]
MNIKLPSGQSCKRFAVSFLLLLLSFFSYAQNRCATMEVLAGQFSKDPALKISFDNREMQLRQIINQRVAAGKTMRTSGPVTIPVVFHIVLRQQAQVSNAQVMAQLDTINKDYAGLNGADSRIISAFRQVFGQSGMQFCLAQRTPDNQPTTGIVRYTTTRTSFTYDEDASTNILKHASTGGADAWDPDRYLNIWICDVGADVLGYATFPNTGREDEQGVVVDLTSLPGGSQTGYNYGKTLTHELGHFFNLFHIWGDDFGACSGSDHVDDTPNQGNLTNALHTGVLTDNCTSTAPGIMYQNFMDYTPDAALFMFTKLQVARMEAAFNTYRLSLGSSDACVPVSLKGKDASLRSIINPEQRLCEPQFTPQVTVENRGSEVLTSLTIQTRIDDGQPVTYRWIGSLSTYQQATINLPAMQTEEGRHTIVINTVNPNGGADEDDSNDELSKEFMYFLPVSAPVNDGFEGEFLPRGWDVVNEDDGITWQRTQSASATGAFSATIGNFDYLVVGQKDYLRSPTINIANTDSAFVSFQVAAASYANSSAQAAVWDTLQVLISTDCGKTYTSLYKKWGSSLVTRTGSTRTTFVPGTGEWRKEEINIGNFISSGEVLVAFQNITGNGNNIYLDDINIRTVTVNPNLKEAGFLVSPNPTDKDVSVQFYPHPEKLTGIYIYNVSGKLVAERVIRNGAVPGNIYDFDLKYCSPGLYVVKAVFSDRVLTKKFVKLK